MGGTANLVAEMPKHERPLSEIYRIAATEWVAKEKIASRLEENRSIVLSKMVLDLLGKHEKLAVNRAEMYAKSSDDWREYINAMNDARAEANLAKVNMKYAELMFSEWQSADANQRRERQMGRQAT